MDGKRAIQRGRRDRLPHPSEALAPAGPSVTTPAASPFPRESATSARVHLSLCATSLIVSLAYRILFPLRVPCRAESPPIPPTNTRVVVPRLPLSRCSKPHHRPLQRTNIPGIIAAPTTARSARRSATLSFIVSRSASLILRTTHGFSVAPHRVARIYATRAHAFLTSCRSSVARQ